MFYIEHCILNLFQNIIVQQCNQNNEDFLLLAEHLHNVAILQNQIKVASKKSAQCANLDLVSTLRLACLAQES